MRIIGFVTLAILLTIPVRLVHAHGFTLRNVGGVIMAENNDPPYFDPRPFRPRFGRGECDAQSQSIGPRRRRCR